MASGCLAAPAMNAAGAAFVGARLQLSFDTSDVAARPGVLRPERRIFDRWTIREHRCCGDAARSLVLAGHCWPRRIPRPAIAGPRHAAGPVWAPYWRFFDFWREIVFVISFHPTFVKAWWCCKRTASTEQRAADAAPGNAEQSRGTRAPSGVRRGAV